ncbi:MULTISPECIES: hypothetical protein [unclassified Staphylococcus]|nr:MULTISPECIES: hypothetical protein [unclassified Staphylococcus]
MDFIIKHMIKIRVLLILTFLFLTIVIVEAGKTYSYYLVFIIAFTCINLFITALENKPRAKNMKVFKFNMLLRFIHITICLAIGYILTIQTHLFETVWIGLGFIAVVALTGIYIDKRDKENTISD